MEEQHKHERKRTLPWQDGGSFWVTLPTPPATLAVPETWRKTTRQKLFRFERCLWQLCPGFWYSSGPSVLAALPDPPALPAVPENLAQ